MTEWKDQYVRIAKVGVQEKSKVPTPAMEDFVAGGINHGVSLPLGYWSEGFLLQEPVVGQCLLMDRRVRNGVEAVGVLQTSLISDIKTGNDCLYVETANSTYLIVKAQYGTSETI